MLNVVGLSVDTGVVVGSRSVENGNGGESVWWRGMKTIHPHQVIVSDSTWYV